MDIAKCLGENLNSAKKTAWKWFSKYIKLRDCLKTTGRPDYCKCISCGKILKWDVNLQAGHLVPGRKNSVLFDEDGVNGQCSRCNKYLSGNTGMYRKNLVDKIGEQRVELCEQRAFEIVKFSEFDYRCIAETYRAKYNKLKEHIYES